MIVVTDKVWKGILAANPGGLPSTGFSFLKPTPPKITPERVQVLRARGDNRDNRASRHSSCRPYRSGSAIRGLRYLPLFILVGIALFLITQSAIGSIFHGIAGGI